MNTDQNNIKSIRFNSNITDEQLKEFFAPIEVVNIERGSWMSDVLVYSEESAETTGKRLEEWFDVWKKEDNDRRELEHRAIYEASVEKYCTGRIMPITITQRNKPTIHSYYCVDHNSGEFYCELPDDYLLGRYS